MSDVPHDHLLCLLLLPNCLFFHHLCLLVLLTTVFRVQGATTSNMMSSFPSRSHTTPPYTITYQRGHLRAWLPGSWLLTCSVATAKDFFKLMEMSMWQSPAVVKGKPITRIQVIWRPTGPKRQPSEPGHPQLSCSSSKFIFYQAHDLLIQAHDLLIQFWEKIRLSWILSPYAINKSNEMLILVLREGSMHEKFPTF